MTDPTNVLAIDDISTHDRLQRRAGGRHRERGPGGDREVSATGSAGKVAVESDAAMVSVMASGPSTLEMAEPRPRGAAGARRAPAARSRCSTNSRRSVAEALARQGEEARVVRLVNVVLMSAIQKGSERHPHRAIREGAARPYRVDGILYNVMNPTAEVPRSNLVAHQRSWRSSIHRRKAAAPGRPHQDPLQREWHRQGNRLPRLRVCRRSSARRSSCASSTRKS